MSCLGVHFALTKAEVEHLISMPNEEDRVEHISEVIEEEYLSDKVEWTASTDKSWDAMHRALTDGGIDWEGGEYPFYLVVLGGEFLYTEDDYVITLKTPEQIIDIVAAIADITEENFRERYYSISEEAYGEPLTEDDFEYTWKYFQIVRDFYVRVAGTGRYVIFTTDR